MPKIVIKLIGFKHAVEIPVQTMVNGFGKVLEHKFHWHHNNWNPTLKEWVWLKGMLGAN